MKLPDASELQDFTHEQVQKLLVRLLHSRPPEQWTIVRVPEGKGTWSDEAPKKRGRRRVKPDWLRDAVLEDLASGMRQYLVAAKHNVSSQYVSDLKNGKR